ncbi:MAG: hypothetical protein KC488_10295, partial [Candidatus Cloacimonetes bacterium]|nr:hypothetical protein [Candidatus Cloacimonadota bacterium]
KVLVLADHGPRDFHLDVHIVPCDSHWVSPSSWVRVYPERRRRTPVPQRSIISLFSQGVNVRPSSNAK